MQGVQELGDEPDSTLPSDKVAQTSQALSQASKGSRKTLLCLSLIAVATLAAYSPVLFDFFNGDDFVHLTWLAQAIHHPELIWRNFYTSWLDGTTTKFYRPLISVFMVTDYLTWGVNGLGFRLTNIAFHLTASAFIYFIVAKLIGSDDANTKSEESTDAKPTKAGVSLWALFSSALFALYPLHPEAVAWITGRVDSIVTAFCTAAVYFYIDWRQSKKSFALCLSIAAMILGLLSKEMAITLPAVFLWVEMVYGARWTNAPGGLISLAKRCIISTLPFWILLAAYFVLRLFALGTFVGGYDDSLFFISDKREFIAGWLRALTTLFVPLNRNLMGSHHIVSKLWPALLAVSAALLGTNLVRSMDVRRHALFLLGWFALCLIPVYKLFNIAPDLQGSRLAYLATVPLCMLLALCVYPMSKSIKIKFYLLAQYATAICLTLLSALVLWCNNQPWAAAGVETNKIRQELRSLYGHMEGDPQTLFLGLPDQIDGAYTSRNALDGMTKFPQLQRDIRNCLMINSFEPIFPFGFIKESIAQNNKEIKIFRWDEQQSKFIPVSVDNSVRLTNAWSGSALKEVLSVPEQKTTPKLLFENGEAKIETENGSGLVELDLGKFPCFSTDFISVHAKAEGQALSSGLDLLYSNDMYPNFELKRRSHSKFPNGQQAIFALRGLPEWALGGQTGKFRLLIPPHSKLALTSVNIMPSDLVSPKISFPNSGYLGTKGYLHLGKDQDKQTIHVSTQNMGEAARTELEITRANLLFEDQNCQSKSRVLWRTLPVNAKEGDCTLEYKNFPTPGIYEIRAWSLRPDGSIYGVASDHIVLSVSP